MTRAGEATNLRRYLARRMLPLGAMLVVVVASGVPTAFHAFRVRELRARAGETARQVAALLEQEAIKRPVLWRYDTLKLLNHLRPPRQRSAIRHVEVADDDGRRIDVGPAPAYEPGLLWESAPVSIDSARVGSVFVATSVEEARRHALLLGLGFAALGILLASLIGWFSRHAIIRAEERIRGLLGDLERSRLALEGLNRTLEAQVEERSARLGGALFELSRKEERLRDLASQALAMQESERRAIARDLHDSVGQALTAIRIHLQLIGQAGAADPALRALTVRAVAMADEAVDEIRRAVARLGAAILDDVGLMEAVERLCDDFSARTGIDTEVELPPMSVDLPPEVESTAYRIVQEALTNVARHAAATRVGVRLVLDSGVLCGEVADDGRGLDGEAREGLGVAGMRERAELLGGSTEVSSVPGAGLRLSFRLPLGAASAPEHTG